MVSHKDSSTLQVVSSSSRGVDAANAQRQATTKHGPKVLIFEGSSRGKLVPADACEHWNQNAAALYALSLCMHRPLRFPKKTSVTKNGTPPSRRPYSSSILVSVEVLESHALWHAFWLQCMSGLSVHLELASSLRCKYSHGYLRIS